MLRSLTKILSRLTVGLLLIPGIGNAQTVVPLRPQIAQITRAPVVGPPPQGISIDGSGTYGIMAKIVWAPSPNAASYVVRRSMQGNSTCCNAVSPVLTTTTWTDTGLIKAGIYMFNVQVNYRDGSVGTATVGIGAPGVQNVAATAIDIAPGRVRLTWDPGIPGTTGFMVNGPGMGTGRLVVGTPTETPVLAPGTYTWTIASVYGPLGVLAPGSTVTHTVSYGTGHYRISLERFKAVVPKTEDPFRSDGRGNEVYVTTQVSQHTGNGIMVSTRMLRTPTFGDVQNFPTRVRAGSASSTGGIMVGDEYPAAVQLVSQLRPPTVNNLPYLLWEGDLSQIDGLVMISPAIWESDEDDRKIPSFTAFQQIAAPNVPYRAEFQPYLLGSGHPLDTWHPISSCPAPYYAGQPPGLYIPPTNGADEPIDVSQDHSYCPMYVAINWAVANSLTTVNSAADVEIPYTNATTNAQYKLYVRVEKLTPAATTPVVAPQGH